MEMLDAKEPNIQILEEVKKFLSNLTNKKLQFVNYPLIEDKNIMFTYNDLNFLVSNGIDVYVFDTTEDCDYFSQYSLNMAKYNSKVAQQKRLDEYLKNKNLPIKSMVIDKPKSPIRKKYTSRKRSNRIDIIQKNKKLHQLINQLI